MRRTMLALIGLSLLALLCPATARADDPLAVLLPQPVKQSQFKGVTTALPKPGEFRIPLTIADYSGVGGVRMVSTGVPLLPGQAMKTDDLRLITLTGDERPTVLPAQFRVLARWWRADNSIRWVLVDTQIDVPAKGTATVYLTNAKLVGVAPEHPVVARTTDDAIVVNTGPAEFTLDRKRFNLFKSVKVGGEELLDPAGCAGLIVEDTYGTKYLGSADTASVDVIESGPMRVRVRARGTNRPAEKGAGYSRGMYDYDIFLDFYAGSSTVKADVVLCNNPAESRGDPTFEDASLVLKLKTAPLVGFIPDGKTEKKFAPKAGRSLLLYQDSNGANTWEVCQGYSGYGPACDTGQCFHGHTVTFRGYRIWDKAADAKLAPATQPEDNVVASGNQAEGTVVAETAGNGLLLHVKNFWEQFPKSLEVSAAGTVRVGLFPREYRAVHYLDDASSKGHEVFLHFFAGSDPNAATQAAMWDHAAMLRPDMAQLAATGALTDLGPYDPPTAGLDKKPDNKYSYARKFTQDNYYGNCFGWQVFPDRWRTLGGHSKRGARQPMEFDNYLYLWYTTGVRDWFDIGDGTGRHFRDVRAYRIEGQDPFGFADWNAFRSHNRCEDWTSRDNPKGAEYEKYHQDYWKRARWWLPNPEHQTLDLPMERYLLMGDQRCLENMRIIAAHGTYFVLGRKPEIHRNTGWSIRALDRYWELTGDTAAESMLGKVIAHYEPLIGAQLKLPMRGADDVNWWFTQIWSRGVAMTALNTGDPRMLKLADTLAGVVDDKQGKYFCTLFGVLYHMTGDEKYRKFCFGDGDGSSLLRVHDSGDFPATAHWLLTQPPMKK
ncbi:MAG: hypothetical protein BIFFINMI_03826 [Phycisphaerae bacterium]|nr:hypothetical protein [Phycisphaerae bacterium]